MNCAADNSELEVVEYMNEQYLDCTKCEDGYFKIDPTGCNIKCDSMIDHCHQCSIDGSKCLSCNDGYIVDYWHQECVIAIANCEIDLIDQQQMWKKKNDEYHFDGLAVNPTTGEYFC